MERQINPLYLPKRDGQFAAHSIITDMARIVKMFICNYILTNVNTCGILFMISPTCASFWPKPIPMGEKQ